MALSYYINSKCVQYKALQPCFCPAIGEAVHFTSEGLNHLLYKKRRPRNHNERHYRVSLIDFLAPVISQVNVATKTLNTQGEKSIITWTLQHDVYHENETRKIKIILMKKGAGKVVFLSVMERGRIRQKHKKIT